MTKSEQVSKIRQNTAYETHPVAGYRCFQMLECFAATEVAIISELLLFL